MVCASCLAAPIAWDANAQGQFITSLCRDTSGHVWIGTEDQGVWRLDPSAPKDKQYTHFTQKDGLGDDNAYALACDKAGRVWAGTLNHGVSVFNGKRWKTYGVLDGPLGSRVFALAVSPKDGGVWGATEAGLFRYAHARWSYFTRADGLPSDQAQCLAFGGDGTLYVGTQCDGIAVGSPDDGYKTWRVTPGPTTLPNIPAGKGLPSALINSLLVASDNTVYAGTTCGLARSRDGETWTFVRGTDWKDKLAGLLHPVAPAPAVVSGDLLTEDYVTCLAEDERGRVFVGHRQKGVEVIDPRTEKRVQSGADGERADDYVSALLTGGKAAFVGLYGGGLFSPADGSFFDDAPSTSRMAALPPMPTPAKPPTLVELNAMLSRVQSLKQEIPIGGGAYLGEDWQTQGDWVGRYGSRYAVLCACGAPLNNYVLSDFSYKVSGFIGPHHNDMDGLRTWCLWVRTEDPRVLWDPIPGYRREAEWDDHGETYPLTYEGPDVWAKVTVPAGLHQLSLYFVNPNGHNNSERNRDYLLEVKAVPAGYPPADVSIDPDRYMTIAQARAVGFWPGVYKRFAIRGPGLFLVKVGRNNSFNTILPALMLDKLIGPPTKWETRSAVWYGKDTYRPLAAMRVDSASASALAAQDLWEALDQGVDKVGAAQVLPYRLMAFRTVMREAQKMGKDARAQRTQQLLANWRWHLALWDSAQREDFRTAMQETWQGLAEINPALKLGNQ